MAIVAQQPSIRLNLSLPDSSHRFPDSGSFENFFYSMPDYSITRNRIAIAENSVQNYEERFSRDIIIIRGNET